LRLRALRAASLAALSLRLSAALACSSLESAEPLAALLLLLPLAALPLKEAEAEKEPALTPPPPPAAEEAEKGSGTSAGGCLREEEAALLGGSLSRVASQAASWALLTGGSLSRYSTSLESIVRALSTWLGGGAAACTQSS
jgi:hypothetical protein